MNKYAGLFLWSLVAVLALIVIAFKPDNSKVIDLKNQIVKINSEIEYKKDQTELESPLKNNFNLEKSKRETTNKLTFAFTQLLGGIHDNSSYEKQKKELQNILGTDLENVVYMHGYNTESKKWVVNKNDSTIVGFDDITNKSDSVLYITTTYEQGTTNQKIKYMYKIHYDLENYKVLSYKELSLN